MKTAHRDFDFM